MHKAGWNGPSYRESSSTARRFLRGATSSTGSGGLGGLGASHSSRLTSSSQRLDPWDQVSDFRTVKYQGHKASADYSQWQEWREWVLSLDDGSAELLA